MTICILLAPKKPTSAFKQRGFSLVEMAVVLVILGVLLGSLISPLSTQRDLSKMRQAEQQLAEVNRALIGFAVLNGRLPCPATNASNGQALPVLGTVNCTQEHGFLPARTLGIDGSYNNNLLLDPWNNPLLYSLTTANGGAYSLQITANLNAGNYRICNQNTCAANEIIAENVVAVIHSRGKDGATAAVSPNQQENADADNDFVKTTYSEAVNNEFDDIVAWLSPNIIALETLRAGNLP